MERLSGGAPALLLPPCLVTIEQYNVVDDCMWGFRAFPHWLQALSYGCCELLSQLPCSKLLKEFAGHLLKTFMQHTSVALQLAHGICAW